MGLKLELSCVNSHLHTTCLPYSDDGVTFAKVPESVEITGVNNIAVGVAGFYGDRFTFTAAAHGKGGTINGKPIKPAEKRELNLGEAGIVTATGTD